MDAHALHCLDFERVRELLGSYAATALGRARAQRIHPSRRADQVREWHAQLIELQDAVELHGPPPFGGITDVREIVRRCAPPLRVEAEELARVGDALGGTRELRRYLEQAGRGPQLAPISARIGDFGVLADRIRTVIDERARVRDEASSKLSRLRADIRDTIDRARDSVSTLLQDANVRRFLQIPQPTIHQDRLVLAVRAEYRGRVPGIIHRSSDSGATIYVEPAQAVELNNVISNLRAVEAEEIARILWDLAHAIHLNEKEILETLDAVSLLDLIHAKLRFARDFGLRSPQITEDGVVRVRSARHPLLIDMQRRRQAAGEPAGEVVPIDFRIGDDFDMLMITGPNTGGKTVTLKTIGLLVVMVQAGLPIPAESGASFSVFDRVLIDVGDEQSMQQSLSTFSAHLKQQTHMLRAAGERTLVLIDELGAGTDPDEGAALGKAILDRLLKRRCRCVVTTHIGALKAFPLARDRAENACVEFDIETLRPTYVLRIGEPGMSNAINIAARLGMPPRLVEAARRNLSRGTRRLHAAIQDTVKVKRAAEDAREAAESAQRGADDSHRAADAARAKLEQAKADFDAWLRKVVHLRPGELVHVRNFDRPGRVVRVRLEQQRAEIEVGAMTVEVPLGDVLPQDVPAPPAREVPPPPKPAATKPKRTGPPPAAEPVEKPPPTRRAVRAMKLVEQLSPGDWVFVKRFQRRGRLVRANHERRTAVVSFGTMDVEVSFEELAAAEGE